MIKYKTQFIKKGVFNTWHKKNKQANKYINKQNAILYYLY